MLLRAPFFGSLKLQNLFREKSKASFGINVKDTDNIIRSNFGKNNKKNAIVRKGRAAIATELEVLLETESGKGIGITKFFEGKNIFITGATGLVGKVLIEKILRSTPIGKIYILIKAEDSEAAIDRVAKELTNSDLFKCLEEKHGKFYQAFVREKMIPVVGNICEPNLGMDSDSAHAIMRDVNVIIGSAATTTLNERYDLSLNVNVNGPQRLMSFAKRCKNLELFVHISTAYVNGEREGLILEKPLTMGENRRKDCEGTSSSLFPRLNLADEMNQATQSPSASSNYDMTIQMKRLGMERAKFYGWFNTYHLTKAMAEMLIHETREDIPVLIIRPTVIESCYKEPYPGWIQGNKMFDPIIVSYGKGQLPAFLGDPDAPMDVIPLDVVANATIAAIAKHGQMRKSELNVYQMGSGVVNPLRYSEFFDFLYEYFTSDPLIESENFARINYYDNFDKIKYFDNFNDFSKYTQEEISRRNGLSDDVGMDTKKTLKLQKQCKAKVAYVEHLCKMYEFVGFFKARFDAENTQKLSSEMSKEEQINFGVDVINVDWRKYFLEIHIPGLRKHVLNDNRVSA